MCLIYVDMNWIIKKNTRSEEIGFEEEQWLECWWPLKAPRLCWEKPNQASTTGHSGCFTRLRLVRLGQLWQWTYKVYTHMYIYINWPQMIWRWRRSFCSLPPPFCRPTSSSGNRSSAIFRQEESALRLWEVIVGCTAHSPCLPGSRWEVLLFSNSLS